MPVAAEVGQGHRESGRVHLGCLRGQPALNRHSLLGGRQRFRIATQLLQVRGQAGEGLSQPVLEGGRIAMGQPAPHVRSLLEPGGRVVAEDPGAAVEDEAGGGDGGLVGGADVEDAGGQGEGLTGRE
jgi:hypothetical protein